MPRIALVAIAASTAVFVSLVGGGCADEGCEVDRQCVDRFGDGWVCVAKAQVCVQRTHDGGTHGSDGGADADAGHQSDAGTADAGATDGGSVCPGGCAAGERCVDGACICDAQSCTDGCCQAGVCAPKSDCGSCGVCEWVPGPEFPDEYMVLGVLQTTDGRIFHPGSAVNGGSGRFLFDPEAVSFAVMPKMSVPRVGFGMSEISGERVLVCGGRTEATVLASCELFSLTSRTWIPAASMRMPRGSVRLLSIESGTKVLALGGVDASDNPLKDVEVYDVASDSWSDGPSMVQARSGNFLTAVLPGGRILVSSTDPVGIAPVEVLNAARTQWLPTSPLDPIRSGYAGAPLPSGDVMVVGGIQNNTTMLPVAQVYRQALGVWDTLAPMPAPAMGPGLVRLLNGRMMVVGGGSWREVFSYELDSDSWRVGPQLPDQRYGAKAFVLRDGRVLVIGGQAPGTTFLRTSLYLQ